MSENMYYTLLSHVTDGRLSPEDCKEIKALEKELDEKKQQEIEDSWVEFTEELKNLWGFFLWWVNDPEVYD